MKIRGLVLQVKHTQRIMITQGKKNYVSWKKNVTGQNITWNICFNENNARRKSLPVAVSNFAER